MVIQWFPGHMKKATREVRENLKKVDMVFEVVDSRCPKSSHNKYLEEVLQNKKRIIIFNKIDLANKKERVKNGNTMVSWSYEKSNQRSKRKFKKS